VHQVLRVNGLNSIGQACLCRGGAVLRHWGSLLAAWGCSPWLFDMGLLQLRRLASQANHDIK